MRFLSSEIAWKTFFTNLYPKKNILYFQFSQNALKCHHSRDGEVARKIEPFVEKKLKIFHFFRISFVILAIPL